MSEDEQQQVVMGLIINAGDAKAQAVQALSEAKEGNFDKVEEHMNAAQAALNTAHNAQTGMLTAEANGEHAPVSLLMVHGQDHLMNAINYISLTQELIDMYKKFS